MPTSQPDLILSQDLHPSSVLFREQFTLLRGTYYNRPVVVKEARDDEDDFLLLRSEARFYRAVGSRLEGLIQRALEVIVDEDGEVQYIVLEELAEKDGWEPLKYFSRLSREEAYNCFEPDCVFYRPSNTPGEPSSFRLFNFSYAESRHECPGADCRELVEARRSLGFEERWKRQKRQTLMEEWEKEYLRKRDEDFRQHYEQMRADEVRSFLPLPPLKQT
ncbi:hypothetical protein JCM10213_005879 [Rhodosporidiobolus nylandii]